jgi:iron(III) transport system permease protein
MRKDAKEKEVKLVFLLVTLVFLVFLMVPIFRLLWKSFEGNGAVTLASYKEVLTGRGFLKAFGNSLVISSVSAVVTTILAFILAYSIHYTNIFKGYKNFIRKAAVIPMLLPTITYGFAIIYSFGKQGLLTRMFGRQFFEIYGFGGLLLGYVIYTLPVSFLLVSNTMSYVDKKYTIVSRIMGDRPFSTFVGTVVRPLLGTLAASFVQCFFLCFTDYGIPASVGGEFDVVATVLYNEMLGSIPNFNTGSAVAMLMLVPSVLTIALLHYLERYNIRYNKISNIEIRKNKARDIILGVGSGVILITVLSVFAVIFVVPLVSEWPYKVEFTMEHVINVLTDKSLLGVYKNSLIVALLTALAGSITTYGAALTTARSKLPVKVKQIIENISLITNTIPGMVIGIAYMLMFSGTPLQNTLAILIICNVIHFFSTPYLMIKNSLAKMNSSWETTAMLMGDTWLKTIVRVVTPNAMGTILEVFSYYFVNAMVTVSAVIFIAGARTMVITTKIKELQYYTKFNEIFVLSLLILFTNLAAKIIFNYIATDKKKKKA